MLKRLKNMLKQPGGLMLWVTNRKLARYIPDRLYLMIKYRAILGRWPNIENPQYMSEKIQWLKLYQRNDIYPKLVDKYLVREYIANQLGEEYLVPLLGVWDKASDIDWDNLPDKFVLKCTHGSHTNIICTDKSKMDIKSACQKLDSWMLDEQTFYYGREWPYKYVKPRIIAEMFIESSTAGGIVDYKFMCFSGKADNVMLCTDRQTGNVQFNHFNKEWQFLPYQYVDKNKPSDFTVKKPLLMDKMFEIAELLASPFPYVRVDLYCENNKIYFGELTFYPQSGFDTDYTVETDLYLGNKIELKK